MTTVTVSGIEIALTQALAPQSLHDLILIVKREGGPSSGMLTSTVGSFLQFAGRTAENAPIDLLETEKEAFLQHLRSGKYAGNSVKSYRNFVNMLLKLARTYGWKPCPFQVPSAWQALWDAIDKAVAREMMRFAIKLGRKPNDFSEDDLTTWCLNRVKAGYKHSGARQSCSHFRAAIVKAGLAPSLPLITFRKIPYGVSLAKMDHRLSKEIKDLLAWKVSAFQPSRPPNGRIRPVSAGNLSDHLCRITGYVQNILGTEPVTSLRELVTPNLIESYAGWAINERGIQGDSLAAGFTALRAAMEQNPRYKDVNLEWLGHLAKQAPTEPQSAIDGRKAKKFISYSEADEIPKKIRAERMRQKRMNPRAYAISVRDELLMSWLVILPWRQINIRNCRIAGANPNLAKEPIAPFAQTKKANWILAREKTQPGDSYWQVRFTKDETKTKNHVHAYLPFDLIAILDEYLAKHRTVLVGDGQDPGTLFVTDKGRAFSEEGVTNRVKHLVAVHAGRATTPHLFRDIVADDWLEHHPEDYLTVSKILWHRSIETTLKRYANRFDESAGVARMDDWRASRRK